MTRIGTATPTAFDLRNEAEWQRELARDVNGDRYKAESDTMHLAHTIAAALYTVAAEIADLRDVLGQNVTQHP